MELFAFSFRSNDYHRGNPFLLKSMRTIVFLVSLALATLTVAAKEQIAEFGVVKSPRVKTQMPNSTVAFPKRGVIVLTSGTMSCCRAIIVDIDAKVMTVGSTSGDTNILNSQPLPNQRVFSLDTSDLTKVVASANKLWRIPSRFWGAMCNGIPCMPTIDLITAVWLIDGNFYRYESQINPINPTSEFYQLDEVVSKMAQDQQRRQDAGITRFFNGK